MKYEPADEQRNVLRQRQASVERLLDHADELDRGDRAILHGVYRLGMAITDLADAAGQQPRTVRLRVLRLTRRINSPEFQYVVRHRRSWPASRRMIAERVILRGRSQRDVADELGISIHRVRQECARIRHAVEATLEEQGRKRNAMHREKTAAPRTLTKCRKCP